MRTAVIAFLIVANVGCGGDDGTGGPDASQGLFDPTGTWEMVGTWGAGTCNVTAATFPQNILVTRAGDQFLTTTGLTTETTTGTVSRSATGAELDLTVVNRDVANDGGSITARIPVTASVDAALRITGSGSLTLMGGASCSRQFTLIGTLRR